MPPKTKKSKTLEQRIVCHHSEWILDIFEQCLKTSSSFSVCSPFGNFSLRHLKYQRKPQHWLHTNSNGVFGWQPEALNSCTKGCQITHFTTLFFWSPRNCPESHTPDKRHTYGVTGMTESYKPAARHTHTAAGALSEQEQNKGILTYRFLGCRLKSHRQRFSHFHPAISVQILKQRQEVCLIWEFWSCYKFTLNRR